MPKCSNLKDLIISGYDFERSQCIDSFKCIALHAFLSKLHLSRNNIDDSGAKAISGALQHVHKLTTLDLKLNDFGDNGTEAILQGCELHAPELKSVDVSGINISATAANRLFRFVHARGGNVTVLNDFFSVRDGGMGVRLLGVGGLLLGRPLLRLLASF